MMTNGEINRLGDQLRGEYDNMSSETLDMLQNHRISHKETLAKVFSIVANESRKISRESISTYRIKRIESILNKLFRYPKMKFSRMWDIGGCRCIFYSNNHVYELEQRLNKNPDIKIRKKYDYIEKPQPEGYRSLHLFVQLKNSPLVIELQIRTREDHSWATLVEITDLIYNSKLKEYQKDKGLLRFHYLLSLREKMNNKDRNEIKKIIKKYGYIEKLKGIFQRNYIEVRKQWIDIENNPSHRYFLIETTKDKVPKISSFSSFQEAEAEYYEIYKSQVNANVVLTHLTRPSYDQISIAYSNYILTYHSFIDECFDLHEKLVEDALKRKKLLAFIGSFKEYNDLTLHNIKVNLNEIQELNSLKPKQGAKKIGRFNKKKKEWVADLNKNINKRNNCNKTFAKSFNEAIPSTYFRKHIFSFVTKRLMKRQNSKLKKLLSITQDKK